MRRRAFIAGLGSAAVGGNARSIGRCPVSIRNPSQLASVALGGFRGYRLDFSEVSRAGFEHFRRW